MSINLIILTVIAGIPVYLILGKAIFKPVIKFLYGVLAVLFELDLDIFQDARDEMGNIWRDYRTIRILWLVTFIVLIAVDIIYAVVACFRLAWRTARQ